MSSSKPNQSLAVKPKRQKVLKAWFAQHQFHVKDSLSRHWAVKRNAIATWLVISVAVALPTLLGVVDTQLRAIVDSFQLRGSITLFLDDSYQETAPSHLIDDVRALSEVTDVVYVSADEGLAALESALNQPGLVDGLQGNPLPAALVISIDESLGEQDYLRLADHWSLDSNVVEVAIDAEWLLTLKQWVSLIRTFSMALGALLLTGAVLTLVNVINAMVARREQELEVVALLGGTEAFNARPFLYAGFWYGLFGGALAMIWVQLVLALVGPNLSSLISHYGGATTLLDISAQTSFWLIIATSLGGVVAAKFAVTPRLKALLPGPAPVRG